MYDTLSTAPQHTVRDLPPFTNVSLRLVLSNSEGRKESEELLVLTDEDGTSHSRVESVLSWFWCVLLNSVFLSQFLVLFPWSRSSAAATSSRSV